MCQLISGLIGVFVGALLAAFIQWVTHRYTTRQRRQHLILLVCSILDDFCSDCREAMEEEGNELTDTGRFKVPSPTAPAFPAEVDWTTIDQDLVRRILALRPAMRRIHERLDENWESSLDYPEVLAYRREKCRELSQQTSELSAELRKMANPPISGANPDA